MGEKIRFSWKLWAVSFALWTAYSLLYSGSWSLWLRSAGRPQPYWSNHIFVPLLNHWINALLTPLVLVFALRHPIRRARWHLLLVCHFAGMLLFTAAHMAIRLALYPVRDQFTGEIVTASLHIFRNMFFYGVREDGLGGYLLIVVVAQAMFLQYQAREREIQSEQLRASLAEARLDALKLQLKPHFLFNTLNAATELVHSDPIRAEQVLVKLSDLLRFTLKSFDRKLISFAEELELLKTYVSIEELRFAGRLSFTFSIDPNILATPVPCMMLQPIVENGIRHGIGRRRGSGTIEVRARGIDERLEINIYDDGPGLPPGFSEAAAEGIGIRNTRERLQHIFPGTSAMSIENNPAGGVAVTINLPLPQRQETKGTNNYEYLESGDRRRRAAGIAETAPVGERTN
jgi:two-component system, LytTR family, sensor kinase